MVPNLKGAICKNLTNYNFDVMLKMSMYSELKLHVNQLVLGLNFFFFFEQPAAPVLAV